ncbi:hypothetical protein Tco_1037944 [Tanacetum coccineum]
MILRPCTRKLVIYISNEVTREEVFGTFLRKVDLLGSGEEFLKLKAVLEITLLVGLGTARAKVDDVIECGKWKWPKTLCDEFDGLLCIDPPIIFNGRLKTHDKMGVWKRERGPEMCVLQKGATVYFVLQERNIRTFQDKVRNVDVVYNLIKDTMRLRVLSLSLKDSDQVCDAAKIWEFHVVRSGGKKKVSFYDGRSKLYLLTPRASFSSFSVFRDSEMVESFCNSYYIPDEVHPTAPGRDRTITQFPEGKVGVYTRLFDYCGYRIPLTKFFVSVLKYFRIHISQLSPFGAARISHFEVLTRVLDLGPSVAVFRAFYTRMYSDGLFSFAKRSLSAPSCLSKPPDSIKNWADHFFWVDSRVFPISVPLYTGGVLEKDPAPHLTARQEQVVQVLSSNKAPFRRYPECFLALVGLNMGLLDYIRTADPRKVQAVEVQKGEEQVTLFDSTAHQTSGSGSGAGAEVSVSFAEGNVVEENVIPEGAFLDLTDPKCDVTLVEKDVAQKQP